jgi:predicted ATPase
MPITELRIEGLRTIEKLRLRLDGLTVLIGENGSGKSSIIEACEILRRATSERFLDEFYTIHGGLPTLLRQGSPHLKLGVTIKPVRGKRSASSQEDFEHFQSIEYDLTLSPQGDFAMLEEDIHVWLRPARGSAQPSTRSATTASKAGRAPAKALRLWVFNHINDKGLFRGPLTRYSIALDQRIPFLSQVKHKGVQKAWGQRAALRAAWELGNIQVHLPFEVTPAWAARALDRKSAMRIAAPLAPANRLEKLGINLTNAFHALKNNFSQEDWQRTLSYIRLGLGEHIEDVATLADPSGGSIGLSLKLKNLDRQVPASQLSDGMLSYLAFVALFRLRATPPSLVALDEPDLHLHPRLLMRVLDMFEGMARDFPVLVATHSDRLLDGLSDPARSVVLCDLDENRATHLYRPDPRALASWLERYRGLGDIRGAGHEASVLTRKERT